MPSGEEVPWAMGQAMLDSRVKKQWGPGEDGPGEGGDGGGGWGGWIQVRVSAEWP